MVKCEDNSVNNNDDMDIKISDISNELDESELSLMINKVKRDKWTNWIPGNSTRPSYYSKWKDFHEEYRKV